MTTYEIEDIKRLDVRPGDILLVTVPHGTTTEQAYELKKAIESSLPVRALLRSPGVEMVSLGPDNEAVRVR